MAAQGLKEVAEFSFLLCEAERVGEFIFDKSLKIGAFPAAELGEVVEDEFTVVIVVEGAVAVAFPFAIRRMWVAAASATADSFSSERTGGRQRGRLQWVWGGLR